jgi:shikimate kinase
MTSGKSTIGPILGNVLGWDYFDLDEEIVKEQHMTIDEIFAHSGEATFRELESKKLREVSSHHKCVIALGGGTIINSDNLTFIKNNGKLIFLKSSPDAIYNRIKNKLDRPLFKDLVLENKPREDFIERIDQILKKREAYYSQADLVVDTNTKKIGPVIDYIANKIEKLMHEKNSN